jgi:hypothetical protein
MEVFSCITCSNDGDTYLVWQSGQPATRVPSRALKILVMDAYSFTSQACVGHQSQDCFAMRSRIFRQKVLRVAWSTFPTYV